MMWWQQGIVSIAGMYYCTMGGLKFVKSAHTRKISDAMSASDKGMIFEIIQ